ncbi:aspartate kinase [Phaeosphaeria sp. MPI-PUGE-AT-0046c]|nr:aspartate kinase [Phaeosphaeria sp. MPI-PUGE-AT-0046c]
MPCLQTKPWIVQKFGGTSIGKFVPSMTDAIIPSYSRSHKVAVVCSARSGTSKSSGTTSLLLEAVRLATRGPHHQADFYNIVDTIRCEHLHAAEEAIAASATDALTKAQQEIRKDCEWLRSFLSATAMLGEISDRSTDRVLALGETLACRVIAAALTSKGIPSRVITPENIVEDAYGERQTDLRSEFRKRPGSFLRGLTDTIRLKILSCEDAVPVITGFFGAMPGSLIKEVSRGYSDLCAALCAVALNAVQLQIWKEVDGVFTADPRKIRDARLLATITSEEAAELTYHGSEVIHPLTIEQIDDAGIPLRLKNVTNPHGFGTIIYPSTNEVLSRPRYFQRPTNVIEHTTHSSSDKTGLMISNGYYGPGHYRRRPTVVTSKDCIEILNIRSHGTVSRQTFLSRISACFEIHDITIDLINSSQQTLSVALHAPDSQSLEHCVSDLQEFGIVNLLKNLAIVSVIGHKIRNVVGIGAEIFNALAGAKINIYLISQGASEINISIVVSAQDVQLALEVVHEKVLGIPRHEEKENAFARGPWLY